MFSTARLIALLTALAQYSSTALAADPQAQPTIVDMRTATPAAVKQSAASAKPKGLTLLYSGPDEKMGDMVRKVSAQCAEDYHPVLRVIVVAVESGEGVMLLDPAGEPIGAIIPPNADLRVETHARLAQIADPLDAMHCRLAPKTGSNLRRQKICTTPREDAERERSTIEWTRRHQDGALTEPAPEQ